MKTFFFLVALLGGLSLAQAQSYTSNPNPADDGGGGRMGSGSFVLTLNGTNMTISGTFSGLSTNSTLAHIHGPDFDGPPTGVGILYDFTSGPGGLNLATLGGTSGGINGMFPLIPKGAGGTYTVAQQLVDLNAGRWYINIHSQNFPGGEIRGTIVLVPEPSVFALLGLGAAGLGWWMRKRTK